jgi:signal transduction histidine kinase
MSESERQTDSKALAGEKTSRGNDDSTSPSAATSLRTSLEALQRRNEELEGLYTIARTFSPLVAASEIYARLARTISELACAEMCLLATYNRQQNVLRAEVGYRTPPEMVRETNFTLIRHKSCENQMRAGRAFYSNEPLQDRCFDEAFVIRYQIHSALGVPLLAKGDLIGFIYVFNRPGGFSARDLQWLETFAVQVCETITYTRLFSTIAAQAEREAVVNRLMLDLQQAVDPEQGVKMLVEQVGRLLEADRCTAALYGAGEWSDIYAEWCAEGVAPIDVDEETQARSPITYWLIENRQPLVVTNMREHVLTVGVEDIIEKIGLRSIIAVPIMHQGRVIGSLSVQQTRDERRWHSDDVDLLTAITMQIGATMENARLVSELREASRLKDEFLATVSHELRTPLTSIKGWVEILQEYPVLQSDVELVECVNAIKNATHSLSQQISDLLDLSRMEGRNLHLECAPTDINQVIMEAVRTVRQTITAHKIELRVELEDDLPTVYVDAQRIQQVLWNLLTNAIKFTPEGGRIAVRSRLLAPRGVLLDEHDEGALRWVVLEVEDTGAGIAPDFLPFIWERFRQASTSPTKRHGGLGIGLALVKEFVEAHGGHVEAQSEEGHGVLFIARLPVPNVS